MTKPSATVVRAWARLVKAQARVLGAVERDLKAAGLPPLAWYDVLFELRSAGGEGLRPVELESRLLIAQHNVSRLIDRLDAAGHVQRLPCAEDGRGQILRLSPSGRLLLKRMWPTYAAAIQRHVGDKLAGDSEAESLAALLGALLEA